MTTPTLNSRLSGIPVFPSLRCLCLHRVAEEVWVPDEDNEEKESISDPEISRLPVGLRMEVECFGGLSRSEQIQKAWLEGDVWLGAESEIRGKNLFREAIATGQVWAVEKAKRAYKSRFRGPDGEVREEMAEGDDTEEILQTLVAQLASLFRYKHLIERYLPETMSEYYSHDEDPDEWYYIFPEPYMCMLQRTHRQVGLTLLAIVEEDLDTLKRTPLQDFPSTTVDGLILFAASQRRLVPLRYLLAFCDWYLDDDSSPNPTMSEVVENAYKQDDVPLLELIHTVHDLSYPQSSSRRRNFQGGPSCLRYAAIHGASHIFFHNLRHLRHTKANSLFRISRSPKISRYLLTHFPSILWIQTLPEVSYRGRDRGLPEISILDLVRESVGTNDDWRTSEDENVEDNDEESDDDYDISQRM